MSCAMNTMEEWYCTSAITADTMMNSTSNTRMQESCFFSDMSLTMLPLITSIVSVDDDVSTSDERVDIDGGQHEHDDDADEDVGQAWRASWG